MTKFRDYYNNIFPRERDSPFFPDLRNDLPGSRNVIAVLISLLAVLYLCGCTSSRNATYFNDLVDSEVKSNIPIPESIIQKNDVLGISISSLNAEATSIFNTVSST